MIRTMLHRNSTFLANILLTCLAGLFVPLAEGQVVVEHGDWGSPDSYTCSYDGLKGMGQDCGTKYDVMVLTAEILSISLAPDNEFRIALRPETVFKGAPTVGMEILTSQRLCLPEMKIGDSWLFTLFRAGESKDLILGYGTRSGPVSDEKVQIDLLRRLASLDTQGIVKGRAYCNLETGKRFRKQVPSKSQIILLTRVEDGRKFKALTDDKGQYEFEPLPAGEYDLNPNTKPGFWTMWSGKIEVEAHGCIDSDLDFQVDGQIAGTLVFPAGVDPNTWEIEVSPVDDPGVVPASAWTDESGQFVLHGLEPGKYIVAFRKTEKRDGPNLKVDLFAPGTPDRANAQVIELGKAKRVEGLEVIVPRSVIE
jgi:hypothetical protein